MSDDTELMGVEHWANRPDLNKVDVWGSEPKEDNGWISVEDRLPKKYVTVRVWPTRGDHDDMASMDRGSIQDSGWFVENYNSIFSHNVTHWQPLPLPPMLKETAE